MMRIAVVFVVSLILAVTFLTVTGRMVEAQGDAVSAGLAEKLDAIAADQKVILDELAAMREQLRILTIRVTQSQ